MSESMIVAKLRVRIEELEQELGAVKAQQKLDEKLWQSLVIPAYIVATTDD